MNGAIYFTSKYGSTREYVGWIAAECGLEAYDVAGQIPPVSGNDFCVIVTPIYYYKPLILPWMKRNFESLSKMPVIFVTVSGAPGGDKLDKWLHDSLPPEFVTRMKHVALRGRQRPGDLSWFHWVMLKIAALMNPDKQAAKEEAQGFDYMDRASIAPAVALVRGLQVREAA